MVEVCCGCVEDCIVAQAGGADRIELNSALQLGGLTPSVASLKLAKQKVNIPIVAMVRPRSSGFCYSEIEKDVMFDDAKILLEAGADGLAFGFLSEDGTVDEQNTAKMCDLIHSYNKEAVYHRAFDCTVDPIAAMDALVACKVDRVLTSGQYELAPEGIAMLKHLSELYKGKIELLAGAGVNETNAAKIMKEANITQVHSSCKVWLTDDTSIKTKSNNQEGEKYDVADLEKVKLLVRATKLV